MKKRTVEFYKRLSARLNYLRSLLTAVFSLSTLGNLLTKGLDAMHFDSLTVLSWLGIMTCYIGLSEAIVMVDSYVRDLARKDSEQVNVRRKLRARRFMRIFRKARKGGPAP